MQPKPKDRQGMLFTSRLEQILNEQHPLCKLAEVIDWIYRQSGSGTVVVGARLLQPK